MSHFKPSQTLYLIQGISYMKQLYGCMPYGFGISYKWCDHLN